MEEKQENKSMGSNCLLQYLYKLDGLDYFLHVLENREKWLRAIASCRRKPELLDKEYMEFMEECVRQGDSILKCYASDFLEIVPEADIEKEIQQVLAWHRQRKLMCRRWKNRKTDRWHVSCSANKGAW